MIAKKDAIAFLTLAVYIPNASDEVFKMQKTKGASKCLKPTIKAIHMRTGSTP